MAISDAKYEWYEWRKYHSRWPSDGGDKLADRHGVAMMKLGSWDWSWCGRCSQDKPHSLPNPVPSHPSIGTFLSESLRAGPV